MVYGDYVSSLLELTVKWIQEVAIEAVVLLVVTWKHKPCCKRKSQEDGAVPFHSPKTPKPPCKPPDRRLESLDGRSRLVGLTADWAESIIA